MNRILLETAQELNNYAKERGVLLTLETLPGREAYKHGTREPLYDPINVNLDMMIKLADAGIAIANDITHTASALAVANAKPRSEARSAATTGDITHTAAFIAADRNITDDAEKPVSQTFAPPDDNEINIADLQRMSMKDLLDLYFHASPVNPVVIIAHFFSNDDAPSAIESWPGSSPRCPRRRTTTRGGSTTSPSNT